MKPGLDKAIFSYSTSAGSGELEEENKLLRDSVEQLRGEVEKYRSPALLVAEVGDIYWKEDERHAVIKVPNGNQFYVNISEDLEELIPGDNVLVEQKNLTVVEKVGSTKKFAVEQFVILEKPTVSWKDVGGLKSQVEDIKEVIELPLKKPELFKKVGITPPKGILLYGPPGTGKTLLAKAVANSTKSTFIEVVGSELVQKFIGEGAKLVKEIFELAREKAPSVVFIDEIDALASKRIDMGTSGEREVQRTFMQLLSEIDGFKNLGNVKIIGCTNRRDILDEAVVRPGRLDRLIEVPNPSYEGLREIFKIHTKKMKIEKKADIKKILHKMDDFSGAEVKAVVTEAGYFAIRANRTLVKEADFFKAVIKVRRNEEEGKDYIGMFG
ncbi:AAA family ATPase [Candidatus Woesearchaeota archaeon]|nr:AAA family ATPase [Candidatus Woesearchaeota archaeon]